MLTISPQKQEMLLKISIHYQPLVIFHPVVFGLMVLQCGIADSDKDKVFAYIVATKARDQNKDINTLDNTNTEVQGIWSDGTTMYVADSSADRIFAYRLNQTTRIITGDGFNLGNNLIPVNNPLDEAGDTITIPNMVNQKLCIMEAKSGNNVTKNILHRPVAGTTSYAVFLNVATASNDIAPTPVIHVDIVGNTITVHSIDSLISNHRARVSGLYFVT